MQILVQIDQNKKDSAMMVKVDDKKHPRHSSNIHNPTPSVQIQIKLKLQLGSIKETSIGSNNE
jgi:hypothetical protein